MAPATALLVGILLAPGLAALVLDRVNGRPIARGMLLCDVAASVDPIRQLWQGGQGVETALELVGDWKILGLAWLAAGIAWGLVELVPVGVRLVLEAESLSRAARLKAARNRLHDEWGAEDTVGQ
jgi:hypothetical protein